VLDPQRQFPYTSSHKKRGLIYINWNFPWNFPLTILFFFGFNKNMNDVIEKVFIVLLNSWWRTSH